MGEWVARRLRAPERSSAIDQGVFRATEVALGVAAAELFAALPVVYRDQLAELPAVVAELEARAAEARADLEFVVAVGESAQGDANALSMRRRAAASRLSDSVAALEGLRLDLLRLHAGSGDVAPLTTLLDAAQRLGDHASRIALAERELEDELRLAI